jgi:cell division septal protein FtsQ
MYILTYKNVMIHFNAIRYALRGRKERGSREGAMGVAKLDRKMYRAAGKKVSVQRPSRRSWAKKLGLAFLWFVLAPAAAGLVCWAGLSVAESAYFQVKDVSVSGAVRTSPDVVSQLTACLKGKSIFHVNLELVRRQLKQQPWIRDCLARKSYPAGIEIRLVERVPTAIAVFEEGPYVVDEQGTPVEKWDLDRGGAALPVLRGAGSRADAAVRSRLAPALQFLADIKRKNADFLRKIAYLDLSDPNNLLLKLSASGVRLQMGKGGFADKLDRYFALSDVLEKQGRKTDVVDLRYANRAMVASDGTASGRITAR